MRTRQAVVHGYRPDPSGRTPCNTLANSTTLKFIHCDFIESGKESVLMTENGVVA